VLGLSGNNPGIQRNANDAGKVKQSGDLVVCETSTLRLSKADVTRLAFLSPVDRRAATSAQR